MTDRELKAIGLMIPAPAGQPAVHQLQPKLEAASPSACSKKLKWYQYQHERDTE
tara:strand:+ start:127 stop:288 length:162 start_codon:yes stop_codon:yes gene_type:complete